MLSNQQFERARRLASALAGIELAERHRELLHRRAQRAGILDCPGLDALLSAAEEGDQAARRRLLCLFTTKFTGFFRHLSHFTMAAEHAVQVVERCGRARLWSAAAATGEEPYSLAMAVIEAFGRDDPPVTILATDLNADSLAIAQKGEYSDAALQGLKAARREHFLVEAGTQHRRGIVPSARRLVECRELSLADATWPVTGPFDVIFCRNVLMYLEGDRRRAVLERMASLLARDGLLVLDPALPRCSGPRSWRNTSSSSPMFRRNCRTAWWEMPCASDR